MTLADWRAAQKAQDSQPFVPAGTSGSRRMKRRILEMEKEVSELKRANEIYKINERRSKRMCMQEEQLIRTIYEFYRNHQEDCDKEYELAMDQSISDIYEELPYSSLPNELAKISVVILTANKFEKNTLHQHVYQTTQKKIQTCTIELFEQPKRHNVTDIYLLNWNGYQILHIACRVTGSYTIGGCADAIRYCINNPYIFPTSFISFGICFGCREEEDHLCDTVISRKIYPYFIGAKVDGIALKTSDDYALSTDSTLENRIENLKDRNRFENLGFNVNFHNYITGEAVISSRAIRDMFIGITTQDIYAGDMEAYGMYKECNNAYRNIPCVVIKSICDWGIVKNIANYTISTEVMGRKDTEEEVKNVKDKLQALSVYHSFKVLDILLKNKVFSQSIYARIKKQLQYEVHEHVWTKKRILDVAEKMNMEIHSSLSQEFVVKLCEDLNDEEIAIVEEKYISKKGGAI